MSKKLVGLGGEELSGKKIRKALAVRPFGGSILIDILTTEETLETKLVVKGSNSGMEPQARILELGPGVNKDAGVSVGQRIYWNGNCFPVTDPKAPDRLRGLIEVHQIKGFIDEEPEA